jgi:antimicrobial peptide system SdpA family protein
MNRRVWLYRLPLLGFWSCIGICVVVCALSSNPIRLSSPVRAHLLAIAPEGWAFFTRDPREPRVNVLHRDSHGRWCEEDWQDAAWRNGLGLTRGGRILNLALSSAIGRVPMERWVPCQKDPLACAEKSKTLELKVRSAHPAEAYLPVGEELVVYVAPPVPWSWSRSRPRVAMPGRILRLRFVR